MYNINIDLKDNNSTTGNLLVIGTPISGKTALCENIAKQLVNKHVKNIHYISRAASLFNVDAVNCHQLNECGLVNLLHLLNTKINDRLHLSDNQVFDELKVGEFNDDDNNNFDIKECVLNQQLEPEVYIIDEYNMFFDFARLIKEHKFKYDGTIKDNMYNIIKYGPKVGIYVIMTITTTSIHEYSMDYRYFTDRIILGSFNEGEFRNICSEYDAMNSYNNNPYAHLDCNIAIVNHNRGIHYNSYRNILSTFNINEVQNC